jgi:2',3'-cyclic-nucleotide 2'-phosphodiesterase (5'-nucleotidase family)
VDLTFDRGTRRLVRREAMTVPMDHTVALDPLVLAMARADLETADQVLAGEIGELTENFSVASTFGVPSEEERLIGSAMLAALRKRGVAVDGVVHGLFDAHALLAGRKTVADAWTILPYENQIVTIELGYADLLAVAEELARAKEVRQLMGWRVVPAPAGSPLKVAELRAADGAELAADRTFCLALNAYDAESGGNRFPVLAELVARPASGRRLHPVVIRDALVDFFLTRQRVGRDSLLV